MTMPSMVSTERSRLDDKPDSATRSDSRILIDSTAPRVSFVKERLQFGGFRWTFDSPCLNRRHHWLIGDNLPVAQHHDPVGVARHKGIVGHEDRRNAMLAVHLL